MTDPLFTALTERLSEIFAHNLKHAFPGAPINEQYAAGVGAVVEATEFLRPDYDNPANVDTEIYYLPPDMGAAQTFHLHGVTVRELLAGSDVAVPEHELSWTISKYPRGEDS